MGLPHAEKLQHFVPVDIGREQFLELTPEEAAHARASKVPVVEMAGSNNGQETTVYTFRSARAEEVLASGGYLQDPRLPR